MSKREIGGTGEGELEFDYPFGMALDPGEKEGQKEGESRKERIFLSDSENHRIQCFDPAGNFLFLIGSEGAEEGRFVRPLDVANDSKNQRILIADSGNSRVQVFDSKGSFLFAFGSEGSQEGEFGFPSGITVDHEGRIFVSEYANHRVQVFDEKGSFLRQFGSFGNSEGEIKYPFGLAFLSDGNLVVAEDARLSVFTPLGEFVRFVGEGKLFIPKWIFVDPQDNIFVPENALGRESLFVFSKEGEELKQIGLGFLSEVQGVVVNRSGEVFISATTKEEEWKVFVF